MTEANPFRELTDQIAVPLQTVADAVGKSYKTIQAYRAGAREPTAEVWERLAEFIELHKDRLPAVARLARQYARRASP